LLPRVETLSHKVRPWIIATAIGTAIDTAIGTAIGLVVVREAWYRADGESLAIDGAHPAPRLAGGTLFRRLGGVAWLGV
jgi:hypothetical protein